MPSDFLFPRSVEEACTSLGYEVTVSDAKRVFFEVIYDDDITRLVHCYIYDEVLEFTVRSSFVFESDLAFPPRVLAQALRKNAKELKNVWCIESIGEDAVLEVMRNVQVSDFDLESFEKTSRILIADCAILEHQEKLAQLDDFARDNGLLGY